MQRQKYQDDLKIGKKKKEKTCLQESRGLNKETEIRAWKKEMNRCNQNRKYFHPSCASSEHLHVPRGEHMSRRRKRYIANCYRDYINYRQALEMEKKWNSNLRK